MFCTKCGNKLPENANFCTRCGAPVKKNTDFSQTPTAPEPEKPVSQTPAAPEQEEPVSQAPAAPEPEEPVAQTSDAPESEEPASQAPDESEPEQPAPAGKKPGGKRKLLLPLLIVLVAVVAVGGFFAYRYFSNHAAYKAALEEADSALSQGDYQTAVDEYEKAEEYGALEPGAQVSLALAYLGLGQDDKAQRLLDGLTLTEQDESYALYQKLCSLLALSDQVGDVDLSSFPVVTLTLDCSGPFTLAAEDVTVQEQGGMDCQVRTVSNENGQVQITYQTEDNGISEEPREAVVTLTVNGVTRERSVDYVTPHFDPARLRLVSTDVSQYPVVKAYFQVQDEYTGKTIEGLDKNAFLISERVSGGAYLNREIKSVSKLEGNAGLNIDLVADKSDSISTSDMSKIQNVMIEFIQALDFEVGDRAEVLAFDSIVQQMCYYTDDQALLINGIRNMSTDGLTAFYDAVYDGVTNAALQGGARCVIAFTDGMDNSSIHTPSELIRYANTQQTPVYIIGVGGGVETGTLRNIAEETGGEYWYIDDLYDLETIFREIYAQQMDYYVVEYESDADIDSYATRDLQVQVSGEGYRGETDLTVTPVRSIRDDGGVNNGSRYMLIKESMSWEDASRRCQEMGGHLATITSQEEMDTITDMAEAQDVKYIWLGGYTSYDDGGNVFGHWVTGEDFSFQAWSENEPSRHDQDGTEEWYIMLWNIPSLGGWAWNDQRNDPAEAAPYMTDGMGFVCEFEN